MSVIVDRINKTVKYDFYEEGKLIFTKTFSHVDFWGFITQANKILDYLDGDGPLIDKSGIPAIGVSININHDEQ